MSNEKGFTASEMLEEIYGYVDETKRTAIINYVKQDYIPKHLYFVNHTDHRKKYYFKPESKIYIENLVTFHSIFGKPSTAYDVLTHQKRDKEIITEFKKTKKELEVLYNLYSTFLKEFDMIKESILDEEIDPEDKILVPGLKDFFNVRVIEKIRSKVESYEDDVEKAFYYFQLGEIDLAEELIDSVINREPEIGRAYYIKALIILFQNKSKNGVINPSSKTKENDDKVIDILLKAYKNWPEVETKKDKKDKNNIIVVVLWLLFNKTKDIYDSDLSNIDREFIEINSEMVLNLMEQYSAKKDIFTKLIYLHLYFILSKKKYKKYYEDLKDDGMIDTSFLDTFDKFGLKKVIKYHFEL